MLFEKLGIGVRKDMSAYRHIKCHLDPLRRRSKKLWNFEGFHNLLLTEKMFLLRQIPEHTMKKNDVPFDITFMMQDDIPPISVVCISIISDDDDLSSSCDDDDELFRNKYCTPFLQEGYRRISELVQSQQQSTSVAHSYDSDIINPYKKQRSHEDIAITYPYSHNCTPTIQLLSNKSNTVRAPLLHDLNLTHSTFSWEDNGYSDSMSDDYNISKLHDYDLHVSEGIPFNRTMPLYNSVTSNVTQPTSTSSTTTVIDLT